MNTVFQLFVNLAMLGNSTNAKFIRIRLINASGYDDSFVLTTDFTSEKELCIDDKIYAFPLPKNQDGTIYEISLLDDCSDLFKVYFNMPEQDVFLHELDLMTQYPPSKSIYRNKFTELDDTPTAINEEVKNNVLYANNGKLEFIRLEDTEYAKEVSIDISKKIDQLQFDEYKNEQENELSTKVDLETLNNVENSINIKIDTAASKFGGLISQPNLTSLNAVTGSYANQLGVVEDTGLYYRWNGTIWNPTGFDYLGSAKLLDKNIGVNYPLVALPKRNNVPVITTGNNNILKNVILNCRVTGANPSYFYRIAYIGLSDIGDNTYSVLFQLDAIKRENYQTTDTRELIYNESVKIKAGQGVKTFSIAIAGSFGSGVTYEFTLDTDKFSAYSGQYLTAWSSSHSFYCYIIDPNNYSYDQANLNTIKFQRNSYGSLPPETYSTDYMVDPQEEITLSLNGGALSPSPHNLKLHNIFATAHFAFPSLFETSGTIVAYEGYANVFYIPFNKIMTTLTHAMQDIQFFTPRDITPYGVSRFTFRSAMPIYVYPQGHIEFLIRVPDQTTREIYRLTLRTRGNYTGFLSNNRDYLGYSHTFMHSEPFQLNKNDFGYGYYSQDIVNQWLDGWWVKVSMPIAGHVALYPDCSYEMRLYRNTISGTPSTANTFKNTDLIILNGSMQFMFDASPQINKRYSHIVKGFES